MKNIETDEVIKTTIAINPLYREPSSEAHPFAGKEATCPKCKCSGDIENLFGFRMLRGKMRVQPVCKACRMSLVKNSTMHTCPQCNSTGPVESDFGYRLSRGEMIPQGWCRKCRASPRGAKAHN